jgi:hypothetical protein
VLVVVRQPLARSEADTRVEHHHDRVGVPESLHDGIGETGQHHVAARVERQGPVILMSQNGWRRRTASTRHDYEVNLKAEMEIMELHAKLDELITERWRELLAIQERKDRGALTHRAGRHRARSGAFALTVRRVEERYFVTTPDTPPLTSAATCPSANGVARPPGEAR